MESSAVIVQSLLWLSPWTVAHQAPLSMGFSRREYWSGLPFPSPGISQPRDWTHISCICRQFFFFSAGRFLTAGPPGKPTETVICYLTDQSLMTILGTDPWLCHPQTCAISSKLSRYPLAAGVGETCSLYLERLITFSAQKYMPTHSCHALSFLTLRGLYSSHSTLENGTELQGSSPAPSSINSPKRWRALTESQSQCTAET